MTASNKRRQRPDLGIAIAGVEYYTACVFLGRGKYDKRRADNLSGIREAAAEMLAEHANVPYCGGVLIYAVTNQMSIYVETVR